ncbi:hypothetical protein MBENS4_0981 [Novosphingobium sp. MBES04]|nr:hypothetical protein MBENS4_0981 [Novosphingobium sp. MBES04]
MAREGVVAARRVEDQEIIAFRNLLGEVVKLVEVLPVIDRETRARQRDTALLLGLDPVFEVAVQGALARIEIDRGDLGPLVGKRDGHMNGGGGLARPTLFVCEDDTMRCHGS